MNGSPTAERREVMVLVGQRLRQRLDQRPWNDECDGEADRDRAERDQEPRPQLVEVLDERGLLAVAEAPREPSLPALG